MNISLKEKGAFSFRNDTISTTRLAPNIHIRAERVGAAICRIYFVDDGNDSIHIPAGFTIMDNTNNVAVDPLAGGLQFYVLAWSDNYTLSYNGQLVLSLYYQRQWSLMGPANVQVTAITHLL
jgi:hypothetical protein